MKLIRWFVASSLVLSLFQVHLSAQAQAPVGIIATIAGIGEGRFTGDLGLADSAGLLLPYAVAVDASGNVLIADAGANRIYKVTAEGALVVVAGTGAAEESSKRKDGRWLGSCAAAFMALQ